VFRDERLSHSRTIRTAGEKDPANARYIASVTATVCLGLTLVLQVAPALDPTLGNRRFHVGLETAAAMVLIFIAAVLLGRFRLNGSRRTLLKFAAVAILALDNLFSAVLTMSVESVAGGGFATWTFAADGVVGAMLLAVAAVLPDRPVRRQRGRALLIAVTTSFAILLVIVLSTALLGDRLPSAFETPPTGDEDLELFGEHWAIIVLEGITAACWAVAAVGFARLADDEEEGDEFLRWLSVGSVIAAVAFVNYALFPSQFTELLGSGDLFFIAAIIALLYGAVREISREEAARIRTAVLEERRRVARDLHDGVAQELAFIASQTRWFLRQPTDTQPLGQIMDAVERALDESRGAIAALSRPIDEPLDRALGHAALDIANRVGARLQLDLDEDIQVPADWRDALLRIAREAVANAVRHGRARTISLQLREGDGVWLRITDDGDGFDLAAPRSSQSFGLTSMRERAESLGGEFNISSAPGSGTTIEVVLP
jgi:signal transduction histidine kinase